MLYAILCYNSEATVGAWPKEKEDAVMSQLKAVQETLKEQKRLGPVLRLMQTGTATTLKKDREPFAVVDGPFAETKEQLLGLYIVECETKAAALDVARDLGRANPSGSYEIRPVGMYAPSSF